MLDKLLSPPVLALPRTTGKLWLDTDASYSQFETCFLQEQPDGQTLSFGYWSRTLNPAERNYSTTDKVARHCMGRNALKALSGREQFHRANGLSRPSVGHKFVRRAGPPCAVAVTPCRIRFCPTHRAALRGGGCAWMSSTSKSNTTPARRTM
jgi:RNase H-like domain found in reverse transcriptase